MFQLSPDGGKDGRLLHLRTRPGQEEQDLRTFDRICRGPFVQDGFNQGRDGGTRIGDKERGEKPDVFLYRIFPVDDRVRHE